jgi:hypothetical protein
VRWTGSDAGDVEVDDEFDEAPSETEQEEQS